MKKPPDIRVQCAPVPRCSLMHHAQHRLVERPSNTMLAGHFGEAYSAQVYWCNISVVGNQIVSVKQLYGDAQLDTAPHVRPLCRTNPHQCNGSPSV